MVVPFVAGGSDWRGVSELWSAGELAGWLASPALRWVRCSGLPMVLARSGEELLGAQRLASGDERAVGETLLARWERALATVALRDVAELAAAFASWTAREHRWPGGGGGSRGRSHVARGRCRLRRSPPRAASQQAGRDAAPSTRTQREARARTGSRADVGAWSARAGVGGHRCPRCRRGAARRAVSRRDGVVSRGRAARSFGTSQRSSHGVRRTARAAPGRRVGSAGRAADRA